MKRQFSVVAIVVLCIFISSPAYADRTLVFEVREKRHEKTKDDKNRNGNRIQNVVSTLIRHKPPESDGLRRPAVF